MFLHLCEHDLLTSLFNFFCGPSQSQFASPCGAEAAPPAAATQAPSTVAPGSLVSGATIGASWWALGGAGACLGRASVGSLPELVAFLSWQSMVAGGGLTLSSP